MKLLVTTQHLVTCGATTSITYTPLFLPIIYGSAPQGALSALATSTERHRASALLLYKHITPSNPLHIYTPQLLPS
jgi:hypothetical protein